jgi:hypothetical protein
LTGAVTGNVTGNVSGTAATVTVAAQPAITSVGTLTSLGVSGAVTAGSFSGPLTGAVTGNVTGNVSGTAATVTVAAQPAITSVGTLTALAVTGNVSAANFNGAVSGNLTGNVTGNVTGNLTGNVTGNASGSAATVTVAAQPAITSVGTLTSLGVTGAVTAGSFSGPVTGNVTGNVSGTAATVTVAAQPAITSLGTQAANLAMGGFKITGGAAGAASTDFVIKSQLDASTAGFVPQVAIACNHVVDDSLNTPPGSPANPTSFIVGASPTGAWAGKAGHVMEWDGTTWLDILGRAVIVGDRFGINFETKGTPAGSFTGKNYNVVQVTTATPGSYAYTFTAPANNYLELVYASLCVDAGHSFAYSTSHGDWIEISAPVDLLPGAALSRTGTTWDVGTDTTSISVNGSNQLQVAGVGGSTAANVHAAELLANAATNANTASAIVKRDASGNFVAGTITATNFAGALTGNASTATTLQTARAINGVSFNGSADVTVTAAAGTLTGATLAAGVTASSLTSVGTLGSLAVTGNIGAANFNGTTNGTHVGSVTGNLTGTVQTAAQPNITSVGTLTSLGVTGAVSAGSFTGPITGAVTGNASTATTLQTARAINGVSFNGSADITVTAAAGTLTGATLAAGVTASSLTSVGTLGSLAVTNGVTAASFTGAHSGSGASLTGIPNSALVGSGAHTVTAGTGLSGGGSVALGGTITLTNAGVTQLTGGGGITASVATGAVTLGSTATSANTASAIVARDISGNFSAGTITATLTGTASNATTAGGFTPSAAGGTANRIVVADASGYINNTYFNSSDNSVATGVTAVMVKAGDNYIRSGTSAAISTFLGLANSATTAAATANTASTIVLRDISGNFSAGTITATATNAKYADLAEMYAADAEYAPGTVVMFGGDAEVTLAADGTRKVAGVVSTNPAYLMNVDAAGVAVALQGRVPVKVMGKVAKGDMLVSAGNGYARAEEDPKLGQVIGKALENFDGAEGVIEAVVGRM